MDPQALQYSNTKPNSTAWAAQSASEYGTAQIYPPNSNVHQSHLQVNPTPPFAAGPDVTYDAETYPGHGLGNYIPDSILDASSQQPPPTIGHHQHPVSSSLHTPYIGAPYTVSAPQPNIQSHTPNPSVQGSSINPQSDMRHYQPPIIRGLPWLTFSSGGAAGLQEVCFIPMTQILALIHLYDRRPGLVGL
jgi:hypothetical protein